MANRAQDWMSKKQNKAVFVEELGLNWHKQGTEGPKDGWDIPRDFAASTGPLNDAGIPWMYWALIPDPSSNCRHTYVNDGDETIIPLTEAGVDVKGAMNGASAATGVDDWNV